MTGVIEQYSDLLGDLVETAPARFEALVTDAIAEVTGQPTAPRVAQPLLSAAVGLKHQVGVREAYLGRFTTAIELLVP